MSLIARFVSRLHTLALAGQRKHEPPSDAAERVSKGLTVFVAAVPIMAGLVVLLVLFQPQIPEQVSKPIIVLFALAIVFGLGWYTDRIFDRNRPAIEEYAAHIREDPQKGPGWAFRRLFGLWMATWGSTALILVAVRWALILLGIMEGPLFQT